MIRFACPGCGATHTAGDEKGGQAGKCPGCQAQFTIPVPEAAGPALVEIAPCPGCAARLSVAAADLGVEVECPYCKQTYTAVRADAAVAPPSRAYAAAAAGGRTSTRRWDDEDRPNRRRRDEDEDDRPRERRRTDVASKRVMAGILALLLGWIGIHKFYLGYTTAGLVYIVLFCFTGLSWVFGIVDGIIYLTKSDEEFIETYQIGKKEWF